VVAQIPQTKRKRDDSFAAVGGLNVFENKYELFRKIDIFALVVRPFFPIAIFFSRGSRPISPMQFFQILPLIDRSIIVDRSRSIYLLIDRSIYLFVDRSVGRMTEEFNKDLHFSPFGWTTHQRMNAGTKGRKKRARHALEAVHLRTNSSQYFTTYA